MMTRTNMTSIFDAVLLGSKFDWAATIMDELITCIIAYQKTAQRGKFTMVHILMILLMETNIWRKEDTEEMMNTRVPHSSTLPVFDIIYDKLMSMRLSPYMDRQLLGYIRPPVAEDQVQQVLTHIQGKPRPRELPEMAPLGSLEELEQPGTSGDKQVPEIDINAPPEPLGTIPVAEGSKKRGKTQEGSSTKRQKTEGSGDESTRELRSRKPSPVVEPTGKKTLVIQDVVVRNVEHRTHQVDATDHSQAEDVQQAEVTPGIGEARIEDEGGNIVPGKMHELMKSNITEGIMIESTSVATENQEENQDRSLVAIGSPTRVTSGSPMEKYSPTRFIYDLRDRREVMLKDLDRQLREQELEIREELRRKKEESPPVVIAELKRMKAEVERLQKNNDLLVADNEKLNLEYLRQAGVLNNTVASNHQVIKDWEQYCKELKEMTQSHIIELRDQAIALQNEDINERLESLKKEVDQR
ncbi:hypothetical protein R1sor_008833 [Riccia sorocarpa]|uniref:Uncharacterized protein n=1 Tax=Riccia sorocarpa TaxID=122646 RepID=A0ABD3H7Z7_9MARC